MADLDAQGRYGEVYDRGYQHYLGTRLGRRHAIWALILYSIKRAMGIKKSWTAKVIPIILYLAVIGLVLVVIGIEAFIRSEDALLMTYPSYFLFIFLLEVSFVATVAPEMICGDRRENVLSLYFSRSISRLDYVISKLCAVTILTSTISILPAVFLWFFRQLLADDPLAALSRNTDELGKVILIGTLIALCMGCGGLVVSSFTGRVSIASAIIFVGYSVTQLFLLFLIDAVPSERTRDYLALFSPANLFKELSDKLFNSYEPTDYGHPGLEPIAYVAFAVGATVAGVIVMVWRYVPED